MSELPWTDTDEPIIIAFLSGEIGEDHPDLIEVLERQPELLEVLREMREVDTEMAGFAREERELRASASGAPPPEDDVSAARSLIDATLPAPSSERSRAPWLLVAAIVLIAGIAITYLATRGDPERENNQTIDNENRKNTGNGKKERVLNANETDTEKRVRHPRGDDTLDLFEWSPPQWRGAVRLRFFGAEGTQIHAQPIESPDSTTRDATTWEPNPQQGAKIERATRWVVEVNVGRRWRLWAEGRLRSQ